METVNLVRFLTDEAASLVREAATKNGPQAQADLDEATELLALGTRMLRRVAHDPAAIRKAA